jgi:hypothetical protein
MNDSAVLRVARTLAAILVVVGPMLTPTLRAQQATMPLLVSRTVLPVELASANLLVPRVLSELLVPTASSEPELVDGPVPSPELIVMNEPAPDESTAAKNAEKQMSEIDRNTACEEGELRGKPCRVSWSRLLGESLIFLAAQHGGNIWMDDDTRNALTHGSFWGDYVTCVENYRWSRWKDDDPFGVDYIGHPMMGAVTNAMYEQNDPKQRALTFENTHRYWFGHLRATAYSAAYSAQWKIGPASEASIGNTGLGYYVRHRDGVYTNETGMQDFFITPIGGLAWNVGEDVIDRYLLRRITHRPRIVKFLASFTTPGKSAANLSRFRAPYYRDGDRAFMLAH